MGRNKEVAKAVITSYLGSNNNGDFTPEGLLTMYEIMNGNDKILLEHVKALKNIFEKAIEEIESENNEQDK